MPKTSFVNKGLMSSLYVHTPIFAGDHTVIHHCYPQTAWLGGVVLYHHFASSTSSWKERKNWFKGRRGIKHAEEADLIVKTRNHEHETNINTSVIICCNVHWAIQYHYHNCLYCNNWSMNLRIAGSHLHVHVRAHYYLLHNIVSPSHN